MKGTGKVLEQRCYASSHKAASEINTTPDTAKQLNFISLELCFRAQAACLNPFIVPDCQQQPCLRLSPGLHCSCLGTWGSSLPPGRVCMWLPHTPRDVRAFNGLHV